MNGHLQELESFLKGVGFEQTYDMSGYHRSYRAMFGERCIEVGLCQDGTHYVYVGGYIEIVGKCEDVIDFVYELGES